MAGRKQTKRWQRVLKRILVTAIVLLVLAGIGIYSWFSLQAEYTVTYTGYNATIGSISNSLSFSGSMALVDSRTYTASSDATVRAVYVAAGDKVRKNDKLLKLSTGETIKADFDGTVNVIDLKKDDTVAAGETLCQIADFDHMTISVRIDEYDIGSVHVGDEVSVTVTATEQKFSSTIEKINYISASTGNVAYYTATCKVNVDAGVYPGMQATVSIPQESAENVVVLKLDALSFDESNKAFVYMYDYNQELARVDVEVGVSNGNYVEIKNGVRAGDTVYAQSKQKNNSWSSMMTSMFGSQRVMTPGSNRNNGNWNNNRQNNGYGQGGSGYGGGR